MANINQSTPLVRNPSPFAKIPDRENKAEELKNYEKKVKKLGKFSDDNRVFNIDGKNGFIGVFKHKAEFFNQVQSLLFRLSQFFRVSKCFYRDVVKLPAADGKTYFMHKRKFIEWKRAALKDIINDDPKETAVSNIPLSEILFTKRMLEHERSVAEVEAQAKAEAEVSTLLARLKKKFAN